MYIRAGNFNFAPGEATFAGVTMFTNRNSRGFNWTQSVDFHVAGEVCNTDSSQITNRLDVIYNAVAQNGYDIGLMHDDGSPTHHYLQSNHPLNLTGNQLKYFRYPGAFGGEYVDGRKFSFGVGAEIRGDETPLLNYYDSLQQVGNGQPDVRWTLSEFGWQARRYAPSTLVRYIHRGYAETMDTWLTPPAPYFSEPPFLVPRSVQYVKHHPIRRPQGYLTWRIDWTYEYNLLVAANGIPTLR